MNDFFGDLLEPFLNNGISIKNFYIWTYWTPHNKQRSERVRYSHLYILNLPFTKSNFSINIYIISYLPSYLEEVWLDESHDTVCTFVYHQLMLKLRCLTLIVIDWFLSLLWTYLRLHLFERTKRGSCIGDNRFLIIDFNRNNRIQIRTCFSLTLTACQVH